MATGTTAPERDAGERLLSAWRGEIVAAAVYELIARRLPAREADILRRMAQAENGHRARLEARMSELAIEIPSRDSVRPSLWLRLQTRIAPVDRLLAAREAAENEEANDLYSRPTGDPVTDALFDQIPDEERGHSSAVSEIRSGPSAGPARRPRWIPRGRGSTRCWAARRDTGPGAGGSAARSTAPTMASRQCSESSRACPARPAGRASCSPQGSQPPSLRHCRWRPARSWPSAPRPRSLPPTLSVSVGRSPSTPMRSRKNSRSSIS